jgi:hypothetical protein
MQEMFRQIFSDVHVQINNNSMNDDTSLSGIYIYIHIYTGIHEYTFIHIPTFICK